MQPAMGADLALLEVAPLARSRATRQCDEVTVEEEDEVEEVEV